MIHSIRRFTLPALACLSLAALGCSDDNAPGGYLPSSTSNSSSSGTGGNNPTNYPAGPYGNDVGDTMAFLEFSGYRSAAAIGSDTYEDVSMLDIKNAGSPFVLLHLAAMFWPSCKQAAQVLGQEADNGNNHLDAVYHIIHANSSGGLPSKNDMDAWILTYGLENPTLASKDASATLAALQNRECVYVIDTSNMTITWKQCGCTSGNCTPSIVAGLSELDAQLLSSE